MKLQVILSTSLAASTAVANPHLLFRSADALNGTIPSNLNGTFANKTNSSSGGNASHGGNGTGIGSGSGAGSNSTGKLKVIVTGGDVPISDLSSWHDVDVTQLFNSSSVLNLTELYEVAHEANTSLSSDQYKGVVIVGNGNSIESLGFLSSVVLDTVKPVVVTKYVWDGLSIANSTNSMSQGVVVVGGNNLLYSGVFSPYVSDNTADEGSGVPIGVWSTNNSLPYWFFANDKTLLLAENSTIRTQFSNFTNSQALSTGSPPAIPIVEDGSIPASLLASVSSFIQGLVVETDGQNTVTGENSTAPRIPVVYAQGGSLIGYVPVEQVPIGTIAGGYLSPVKARLLLSIALANGVSSTADLQSLFY